MNKIYPSGVGGGANLRSFWAPGYASISMTYFNSQLSLRFHQYSGKSSDGSHRYDLKNGMTTTVNYEGAAYLYQAGKVFLNDANLEKEIKVVLPCYKATLILERKRDEANKMVDYFTLEKNNRSISYKFMTRTIQVKENEQMVTKVIQSDLCAFAETFKGYLIDIGGAFRFNKLADNFENSQDENQQVPNTITADDGYPYEYY